MKEPSTITHSELFLPRKVLRVPHTFATPESADARFELKIQTLFQKYGFTLEKGGSVNMANPLEIGFKTRGEKFQSQIDWLQAIASDAGVTLPKVYSPHEILATEKPIMAKTLGSHRGEGKVLLSTQEDKARFITYLGLGYSLIAFIDNPQGNKLLTTMTEKIKKGNLAILYPYAEDSFTENYYLQEFVDTNQPNNHSPINTSLQVVADAFGTIHYGKLRWTSRDASPNFYQENPSSDNFLSRFKEIVLSNPHSPLYIPPIHSTTNLGSSLILDGGKVTDPEIKYLLEINHAEDPSYATIPHSIAEAAQRVSRACRPDYPIVGVDFVGDYFIEANIGPQIDGQAIGISNRRLSRDTLLLSLIEQIIRPK